MAPGTGRVLDARRLLAVLVVAALSFLPAGPAVADIASVDPSSGTVQRGDTISATVSVTAGTGSCLTAVASHASITVTFDAGLVTVCGTLPDWTTRMHVKTATLTPGGDHTVTIEEVNALGIKTDTVVWPLEVIDPPPTVSVASPDDGATVSGTVTVSAQASDDDAVVEVEFLVDGASIGKDTLGLDGWSISWDSTSASEDDHQLTARATDTAGQKASDSITVTVDNVDSPPSVSVASPDHGSTVSGTITVSAQASDDKGVADVEFLVDGGSIGKDTEGGDGWSISWDTTSASEGDHQLTARATDTAGQKTSHSITVTVDNVAGTTTTTTTTTSSTTTTTTTTTAPGGGGDGGGSTTTTTTTEPGESEGTTTTSSGGSSGGSGTGTTSTSEASTTTTTSGGDPLASTFTPSGPVPGLPSTAMTSALTRALTPVLPPEVTAAILSPLVVGEIVFRVMARSAGALVVPFMALLLLMVGMLWPPARRWPLKVGGWGDRNSPR